MLSCALRRLQSAMLLLCLLGGGRGVSGFLAKTSSRRLERPGLRLLRQGRTGSVLGGGGVISIGSNGSRSRRTAWLADFLMGRKIDDEAEGKEETDPGPVKGTKLKILKYPNPKLRSENAVVSVFDDALRQRASEMLLVMYAADGIGLAAPQVGLNERLMVFNELGDPSKPDKEMVLVNPTILSKSDKTDLREEGCLSFPLINGKVERSTAIEVQYQSLTGETVQKKFEGMPARIFQHEYDHLDKVLFIDRLVPEDKAINQKRLDKYVKKYGPGALP